MHSCCDKCTQSTFMGCLHYMNFWFSVNPLSQGEGDDMGSWPLPPPSLKNHKNLKAYQASFQCWSIIGMPVKSHFNGVWLAGRWWSAYSGIWILSSTLKKKNVVKVGPPLTKLSGSAHVSPIWRMEVSQKMSLAREITSVVSYIREVNASLLSI